jgi:hypothetical protein
MADYDLDALLTWFREWERKRKAGAPFSFDDPDILRQAIARAIEGLELLKQRDARAGKRDVGRKKGTGLGKEVTDLMTAGVSEADAIARVAENHRMRDRKPVRRALLRHRKSAKNPL